MEKTLIHIKGMHCRSCEILIEDELLKLPGVTYVAVSHQKGIAQISHQESLDSQRIKQVIGEIGYEVGQEEKPFLSHNISDYIDLLVALGILLMIYLLAESFGLFNLFNVSGNFKSLPMVLAIGLTAGFSTCMALVGGLILGASAKFAEKHPTATPIMKFKPHLFFNMGRIISYFVFGGIIGYAGTFFQLSTSFLGLLTIFVGIIMILLGAQLIGIFPRLNQVNITLPKFISRVLGIRNHHEKEYSHKNSVTLGALTFFLPCGFTQAMQLYAISTGDPLRGALTMGTFAIGTAPGLLGIGGLTSIVRGAFAKSFFKFAGIIVIALAIFNLSNGYNLTGLGLSLPFGMAKSQSWIDPNVNLVDGVQVIKMTQNARGYSPNNFTIIKNIPVKWIITSTDINNCASSLVSSKLSVRRGLKLGENIIEFTPKETGRIGFSCLMGMYRGNFTIVESEDDIEAFQKSQPTERNSDSASSCSAGGGCGARARNNAEQTPVKPINQKGVQVLKASYSQRSDILPNRFIVKAGQPVRLEIDVREDGYGCMGSITVPGLVQNIEILTEGEPVAFNFTPPRAGDYLITCSMGMPRGVITAS